MYKLLTIFFLALISCKNSDAKDISAIPNISDTTENTSPKNTTAPTKDKNVEIVFCLDATGSMSGLISTAKEKIWDIASELAQNNEVDSLKIGMVFYRDRGDLFVTKQIALTTDLDGVYSDLLEIQADGGGDAPESVNQALYEAVTAMTWSTNPDTYKTIFVVGDCPPHMDYKDDVTYMESCSKALEKNIHINTIKLGNGCPGAKEHFSKMASCGKGDFLQLDQNATDYVVASPYDDEIEQVSKDIDNSRLYYGNDREQNDGNLKKEKSLSIYASGSKTANSARASYKVSNAGDKSWMGNKEIANDVKNGTVKIEELSDEELPPVLKGKTLQEKKAQVAAIIKEREENIAKLKTLNKNRATYIKDQKKATSDKDSLSFSKEVIEVMKKQAGHR